MASSNPAHLHEPDLGAAPSDADSRTLTASSASTPPREKAGVMGSSAKRESLEDELAIRAVPAEPEAQPDSPPPSNGEPTGSSDPEKSEAWDKNSSELAEGPLEAQRPVVVRKRKEGWRRPWENAWRMGSVLLAFLNFGLNDASYGVSCAFFFLFLALHSFDWRGG